MPTITLPTVLALALLAFTSNVTANMEEKLSAAGVLEALGHSFFTLSVGMGAMLTYGSYMRKRDSIPKAALTICALDTMIAIMACIIMFSIIFCNSIWRLAS